MGLNTPQTNSLRLELDAARAQLIHGLAAIEEIGVNSGDGNSPVTALTLLAAAFERLFKVLLVAKGLQDGSPPKPDKLRRLGHKVLVLRDRVVAVLVSEKMLQDPEFEDDISFIRHSNASKFFKALEEFAKTSGRYFWLELSTDEEAWRSSEYWQDYPASIWWNWDPFSSKNAPDVAAYLRGEFDDLYELRRRIRFKRIYFVERLIQISARLLAPCIVGPIGPMISTPLRDWAEVPDEVLGKRVFYKRVVGLSEHLYRIEETSPIAYRAFDLSNYGCP